MDQNDRSIISFVMVGHAMVHTYELSIPILMTVWLLEFSTSTAVLGVAVAIGYGLFGLGALPGGILVDRFGSQTLITVCLAGMGVAFLSLSLVPGIIGITIALAVWGAAASVYHPAGLALISNGVKERGRGFAFHGMAGNTGIAGGPLVTALLLVLFDWRLVTALLAGPALLAALVGRTRQFDPVAAIDTSNSPNRQQTPSSLSSFTTETRRLFTVGFLLIFVIVGFNGLYYRGMLTFLPELLGDFLVEAVGDVRPGIFAPGSPMAAEFDLAQYLYVGLLTVGIGGQYVGGYLTERVDVERGVGVVLTVLTLIALLFVPAATIGLSGLLLVSFALGGALFAIQPLTQATIAKYSLPESRGLSFGYTYLAIFGVGALGAAVSGTVLAYADVSTLFIVLAMFSASGAGLALLLDRVGDPSE